ncbi:MAG: hypothetical protein K2N31_01740 [Treponemataceae bacterium]|nr:hypothetical protein [Treponemataceae bacterium]
MRGDITIFRRGNEKHQEVSLIIIAALAAVLGFVAYGDDDPSTVAVYKADATVATYTVTFYDDDTFSVVGNSSQTGDVEMAKGTHTGDPAKDETITLTFLKLQVAHHLLVCRATTRLRAGKLKYSASPTLASKRLVN